MTFDEALDAVATSNTALYQVLGGATKHHKAVFSKPVAIKSTTYNPTTHTVTLNLAKPFKGPVQVTVEPGLEGSDGVSTRSAIAEVVA